MHTFVGPRFGLGIERIPSKWNVQPGMVDYYCHSGDYNLSESQGYTIRARWLAMRETGFGVAVTTNCCDGLDGVYMGKLYELRVLLGKWLDQCLTRKPYYPPNPGF